MINAYEIGVSLSLTGNLGAALTRVIEQLGAVNKAAERAQAALSAMETGIGRMAGLSERVARAWQDAAAAMERGARATAGGGGSAGGGGRSGFSGPLLAGAAGGFLGGSGSPPGGGGGGGGPGEPLRLTGPGRGPIPLTWPSPQSSPLPARIGSHELALAAAGYGAARTDRHRCGCWRAARSDIWPNVGMGARFNLPTK